MFFEKPLTYLITEGQTAPKNFPTKSVQILNLIEIAVENKVSLLQIREKNLPARLVFELAVKAVNIARGTETKILINDRADIALAANAAGVHLTSKSLSAQLIRKVFPTEFLIGVSTHAIEEAEIAAKQGADFITFSSIFATPGKGTSKGLRALRELCEKLKPFPVVALGGINETNFQSVLENGAGGFAAIRFLNDTIILPKLMKEINAKACTSEDAKNQGKRF